MQSLNPFPFIYKSQYDFKWESIKDKVCERLATAKQVTKSRRLTTPEKDGGITTVMLSNYDPPHTWDEFDLFKPWLYDHINTIWDEWHMHPMNKHLSKSWINCHPPGAWTVAHHHHNSTVAVVAYLHVPENSGRLMIENPLQIYKHSEPLTNTYFDEGLNWKPIEVKTNDVLFFPGWLEHKTEKNLSNENRYVISLNIMGRYV